jgi:UDP:flavonoid glycosyltransferase YjiC (YdhE family)
MLQTARSPRRILLFAEAVTLAHVARPLWFARCLRDAPYRIAFAASQRVSTHIAAEGMDRLELDSIEPGVFLAALADGKPLYDAATLCRYVEADLAVIAQFRPDLVVGDFRLSLSISARQAKVPYVSIASAYWSPHYTPPRWPVPTLPITRSLPIGLAQALFSAARPLAFAMHCGPLNAARRCFGLPPLPRDLRRIYTDADRVAYSDLPELFPVAGLPPTHRFVGPALWEPALPLPAWWEQVPTDRPVVYVTLGSSGDAALMPAIADALASLPVSVLLATAGAAAPAAWPQNVFAAPYLPGLRASARAQLVVCNGGNLTAYQAVAGGAPVLGICGNLDQFLNMQAFERAGAGRTLRADRFSPAELRHAVGAMLGDDALRNAAATLRAACARHGASGAPARLVEEMFA